jgi:hypothetical protein
MVGIVHLTPVIMIVSGWLLINRGARKHRFFAVLGMLVITAAMFTIVQGRN